MPAVDPQGAVNPVNTIVPVAQPSGDREEYRNLMPRNSSDLDDIRKLRIIITT